MKLFALVLARDTQHVDDKIKELEEIGIPFVIVCGEKVDDERVVYRRARGKYDAINYGACFLPRDADLILMNDVDTRMFNLNSALKYFHDNDVGLVFARVSVSGGPQKTFYKLLDFIRRLVPITASGELIIIRRELFEKIVPMNPSKAEDSYIMFKVLEYKKRAIFCEHAYVETVRTQTAQSEETYKRRTVGGLYQALSLSNPPLIIRLFYFALPLGSPLLLVLGKKGYYWMRGILLGFTDYLRGDKSGQWKPIN